MSLTIISPDASQKSKVLAHLRQEGSISAHEALLVHGVHRLAARVLELRQDGHRVRSEPRRDSAGRRYVRYFLGHAR